MTAVSVLVPTRDRPYDLARCLPTILANVGFDFELIVADQGADDAAREVASAIKDPRLRYIRCELTGKSRALNAALSHASGSLIALTDDDCAVPADWLQRSLVPFESDPELGLILGPLVAAPHDLEREYVPVFVPTTRRLHGWRDRIDPRGVGANLQVRRDVLEQVGGFDECVGPGSKFRSGDDLDLAYRALRAGYSVLQAGLNPPVVHWGARPYADGSASRLIWNNYYGKGARITKQIRCGDPVAPLALAYNTASEAGTVALNLARGRRPTGFGRLAPMLIGAARAVRQPIDRKHRVFKSCPSGP